MAAMAAEKQSYGHMPIPNGGFNLKKDGREETKKTENCDNLAAWVSSSSDAWVAGLEAGSYRRGKHVLYMNKGAWVEQELSTVKALGGAWYTIRVDACRSAEKADQVVVEIFADGRVVHSDKVGPLSNGWKEYQTQWQALKT